jgi:protein-L-isoaspartate(D-aspartate) O-methyltransferase
MNAESARQQMVAQQVRAWTVLDPAVLRVMGDVPREKFVPAAYRSLAFADTTIPLPEGRLMMTPQVEGRVLQALEISPGDAVLEVGTGSGFLTACLARLGGHVTSVEISSGLADTARRHLREAGIGNCEIVVADIFQWRPERQYNGIALGGSLPVLDPRFQEWLAPGGRLFAVVGEAPAMEARLLRRMDRGEFKVESLFETVLPALDNAPRPETFAF